MNSSLDFKYKKSAHHNYLVLHCQKSKDYQCCMYTENKVPGLLQAELRMDNGEEEIYYEISSLQPLYRLYEHKGMNSADYKTFIRGLLTSFDGMQEYLLDEARAILDPKYIYISPETGSVHLLFYPYEDYADGFLRITEFLMDHAEHDDGEAVRIAYDLYKIARQENFVIGDFRKLLEKKEEYKEEKAWNYTESEKAVLQSLPREESERLNPLDVPGVIKKPEDSVPLFGEKEEAEEKATKQRKGFLSGIKKKEKKTEKRASGFSKISSLLLKPKEEEKEEIEEGNIYTEKIFTPKNMGFAAIPEKEVKEKPAVEEYGKTTFFENLEEEEERILVQTNKGKDHIFSLTDLPKTVGKLEGTVDFCIRDGSISRMHARFVEKNGRVYIEDCNSTNGSFVNGMRLNEEESVLIEAGDEIRFGKVAFEYR